MRLLPLSLFLSLFLQAGLANAAEVFQTDAGAIRGYDPVAYFTELAAVPGEPEITHRWRGATWHFSSTANRDAFAANPERYAPQYGGFCAYGTAKGYQVSTAPDAFAIEDGKLYLNYNASVQSTWNQDRSGYIGTADSLWPGLIAQPYESDAASTAGR